MLRLKVTELARGFWQAAIEGEEAQGIIDRAPDQALAGLVRANLGRFGVAEIVYLSVAAASEAPAGYSQGDTVFPTHLDRTDNREEGS